GITCTATPMRATTRTIRDSARLLGRETGSTARATARRATFLPGRGVPAWGDFLTGGDNDATMFVKRPPASAIDDGGFAHWASCLGGYEHRSTLGAEGRGLRSRRAPGANPRRG